MSTSPILQDQQLLVRNEESTDDRYGCSPGLRPIPLLLQYGLLLIDKPAGPTSHEVVAWVRRILGVDKAGHSGTLDPSVTGVLPTGLGDATKVLFILLMGTKEYHAIARLHDSVNENQLKAVLDEFTAQIYQRPPQRSAVRRQTRMRTIYELEMLEKRGNLLILRIACEAGTYVRKLIYDIGEALGPGATMAELRRTRVSGFNESGRITNLHELTSAIAAWKEDKSEEKLRNAIMPVEEATKSLPSVFIRDSAVDSICHGAQLAIPGVLKLSSTINKGDVVAVYTQKGEIVSIAESEMASQEIAEATKGIAFSTKRVIMRIGTYPKMWKHNTS